MLRGKKAIITGATRGIGRAIAVKFLENGADVAVCGSRAETAEKAAGELKKLFPERTIIALSPALGNPEEVNAQFAAAAEKLGGLDILVNNAGLSAREPLLDYSYEQFEKVININLN